MSNKIWISVFIVFAILTLSNCESSGNRRKGSSAKSAIDYLKKGKDIASATQSVLAENLVNAIGKNGTDGALEFCNIHAIPLTDSTALALNTEVKRVSDKNRNAANSANKMELDYINQAKLEVGKTGDATPKLQEMGNQMVAYYPIITNSMCLNCHGTPNQDIIESTYSLITEKYPNDKATGYKTNEIRGIWVVSMYK